MIFAMVFVATTIATLLAFGISVLWLNAPYSYPNFARDIVIYGMKNAGISIALLIPVCIIYELQIQRRKMVVPMWVCLVFAFVFSFSGGLEGLSVFFIQLLRAERQMYAFFILVFLNALIAGLAAYFPHKNWMKRQKANTLSDVF